MIWLFAICTAVLIVSAVAVVASRQPVHSVVALIVNFAGLAVLFLTLSAEFLAMIQVIVYAGAILVLFLFVLTLLTVSNVPVERGEGRLHFQAGPALATSAAALALLVVGVNVAWSSSASKQPPPNFGGVGDFGAQLLTTHLFAFEATAFVLLVAIIGVILMAARKEVRF